MTQSIKKWIAPNISVEWHSKLNSKHNWLVFNLSLKETTGRLSEDKHATLSKIVSKALEV